MYKNLAGRAVSACLVACFFSPVFSQTTAPTARPAQSALPLKVAFVYVTPVLPSGWTHQHELGREAAQAAFGSRIQTSFVANVPEGADAERVIRDLAQHGNQLIFTTSFGYMEPTLKVAKDFPNVKFESITGYKTAPNVATANARYYEGRYLSGIAAGRMTRTHVAGYVAGFPIPEVLQGIDAFTLGMRSVDPNAQVKVIWLDTWFDPGRERDAAMTLIDQGVDVLSFHTASIAVMAVAQERGKLAIAYHSDMRAAAPDAQILAVTHQWGGYDTRRIQAVLDGTWKRGNVWGGVKDGMIRVGDFGPKVPKIVRDEVLARQKDIAAGRLQPFRATGAAVRDNEGRVRIAAGHALDDAEILKIDWLAEGVQGRVVR